MSKPRTSLEESLMPLVNEIKESIRQALAEKSTKASEGKTLEEIYRELVEKELKGLL